MGRMPLGVGVSPKPAFPPSHERGQGFDESSGAVSLDPAPPGCPPQREIPEFSPRTLRVPPSRRALHLGPPEAVLQRRPKKLVRGQLSCPSAEELCLSRMTYQQLRASSGSTLSFKRMAPRTFTDAHVERGGVRTSLCFWRVGVETTPLVR
jgi:hypothetical protein